MNQESKTSSWSHKMTLSEQWTITKEIFGFALEFKTGFLVAAVMSILNTAITVALPRIIQIYIDRYLAERSLPFKQSLWFIGIYLGLILLQVTTFYLSTYLFNMASEQTVESVRNRLFTKIQSLGMRYFDQTPGGSIVSRVTNDTETLKEFWAVFLALFEGITSLISVFIGMYLLDKKMALTFLIFVPVMLLIIWIYQNYSSQVYRSMREQLSFLNTKLNESILGMSIIQHFRQEKRVSEEFAQANDRYFDGRQAMVRMNSIMLMPVISFLETISLVLVFYLLGGRFFAGSLSVGVVYAFVQYATNFFRPMGMMMDNLSIFQDGLVASSRILRVLENPELVPEQKVNPEAKTEDAKIEFRNVSFAYDEEHYVLHDISFTVNPGETVALVGHTGSGKSSIINVLMRFYEFQEGQILIDGYDLREFSYETLREDLGLVLQDSFLFYGDVARNIRLLDSSITDQEVCQAARFVNADRFIESSSQGYHKPVLEGGAGYSSGEKQLISFARTMAHDPKILILDEATASIDTETEHFIQESLKKMRQDRTTIAIAHRLSTIRDANLILVLEKGRIVERGTHEELIEEGGLYKKMYELQSMPEA